MEQLILHLFGDYVTQSEWMALNKTKACFPAFVHALTYSLPFLLLTTHIPAMLCIFATHFFIDRFRLARYVVWAKNALGPLPRMQTFSEAVKEAREWQIIPAAATKQDLDRIVPHKVWCNWPWSQCTKTGYPPDRPEWLVIWLLIIADNTMHLAINYAALRWL